MFTFTDHRTTPDMALTASSIYELRLHLEGRSYGLTTEDRITIDSFLSAVESLELGETLTPATHYAASALGITIERTNSNKVQHAEWETTKRGGKTTKHSADLSMEYYGPMSFEYNVRYSAETLYRVGGKTVWDKTSTVESFGSMKRASAAYNFLLESGKGPREKMIGVISD